MKRLLTLLIFSVPLAAQQVQFQADPKETIEQRLSAYAGNDRTRAGTLKRFFQEAGCPELSEQAVKGQKLPNVLCVLPGSSGRSIIVGAHFDHADIGDGVLDNWSGASLLPGLLRSLTGTARRHTYIFVGFTAEEKGLVGSRFYINHVAETDQPRIDAMVNLDTLGLGPTKVWATHANPALLDALARVAKAMKLPITAFNVDGIGSSDSEPFRDKKVPAITIHSATTETLPLLHSLRDNPKHLRLDDYYDSYRLIAAYLAFLDTALPPSSPEPPSRGKTAQP